MDHPQDYLLAKVIICREAKKKRCTHLMSNGVPGGSRSSSVYLVVGLSGRKARPNITQLRVIPLDKK